MVLNSWENITLICGNHENDHSHKMIIHQGAAGMSTFYSCPCYQSPLKEDIQGRSCNNRMSITDYEHMLNILMNEALDDHGVENILKGYKWSKKGIDFEVIDHQPDKISVVMKNRKAIRK